MSEPSGNTSATGGPLYPAPGNPPLDDLDLDTAIGMLIAGVAGLDPTLVLPRWQQEERPRIPDVGQNWISVGVNAATPDDTPSQIHHPDGDGYTILRTFYRLDVLASFYGPNSDGLAKLTRDAFHVAQNREAMRAQGLNLVGFDAIRRVPEIAGMQTRRRSDLSFTLTQVIERRYEIRNLLSLDGQIQASGGRPTGPAIITDPLSTTPPTGA